MDEGPMRVDDIAKLVAEHGARRFLEKRGWALPLALGFTAVSSGGKALDRIKDTRGMPDRASHEQLAPDVLRRRLRPPG